MSYAILHIPPQEVTERYGIGPTICNLAIGDHDLTRFHLTDSYETIEACYNYYQNKWPRESYRIVNVEEI